MALGDQVQVGTSYEIEFGDAALLSMTLTGYTDKKIYDQEEHKDQRGATDMILLTNPRYEYTFSADVPASTDLSSVYEGAVVAFTNADGTTANGRVTSVTKTRARSVMTVSVTILREDSMQSTYDADETPQAPVVTLSDEGAHVLGALISVPWSSLANAPDYVDVYLSETSTRPATPHATFKVVISGAPSGTQNFMFTKTYGGGETIYAWAIARNGNLSSEAGTDSGTIA